MEGVFSMKFDNIAANGMSEGAKAEAQLGLKPSGAVSSAPQTYPWSETAKSLTKFYPNTPLDPKRWDKLYPYKLLVVDARTGGIIQGGGPGASKGTIEVSHDGAGLETTIKYAAPSSSWSFTLPISPQSLSTDMSFAISTTATQQGVAEEHNGVVFKTINMSMTMGVFPGRQSIGVETKQNTGLLQTVFQSSIASFSQLQNSVNALRNIATSDTAQSKPDSYDPSDDDLYSTGYYQALYLSRFLEQYALAKKDPAKKFWRLCFFNAKDNEAYLVTPQRFTLQRSVQKPSEYLCNLSLKAFRRIDLEQTQPEDSLSMFGLDSPDFFQRAINTITAARNIMSNAQNLIRAVRSDFRRPFELLRQVTVLLKETAGVVRTAADLPSALIKDLDSQLAQIAADLDDFNQGLGSAGSQVLLKNKNKSQVESMGRLSKANGTGLGLPGGKISTASSPALNPFANPEGNFELLNALSLNNLRLSQSQRDVIQQDIQSSSSMTTEQLRSQLVELRSLAQDIANQFGAGDEVTYDILGLPPPKQRAIPLSIDELEILESLYEVLSVYDQLTASKTLDDSRVLNPIQYTKDVANLYGIPFQDAQSKLLAPVPFGLSIEQIALRYLGDAKRWIEIAALNNLREPFIDEVGFELNLLSNGEDRRFTLPKDSRLYVGQKIYLQSSSVSRFSRSIVQIDEVGSNTVLVTVDGKPDLSALTVSQGASIKAFRSGTVNSQDQIFIPVEATSILDNSILPPEQYRGDESVALSKVDFLLSDSGDIVIDSSGDIKLAAGITNLIQALKTIVLTELGSDISNPTLGIDAKVGDNIADIQVASIFSQIDTQIKEDPRFSGIVDLKVKISGPAVSIYLAVQETFGGGIVPISFVVDR